MTRAWCGGGCNSSRWTRPCSAPRCFRPTPPPPPPQTQTALPRRCWLRRAPPPTRPRMWRGWSTSARCYASSTNMYVCVLCACELPGFVRSACMRVPPNRPIRSPSSLTFCDAVWFFPRAGFSWCGLSCHLSACLPCFASPRPALSACARVCAFSARSPAAAAGLVDRGPPGAMGEGRRSLCAHGSAARVPHARHRRSHSSHNRNSSVC